VYKEVEVISLRNLNRMQAILGYTRGYDLYVRRDLSGSCENGAKSSRKKEM